MAMKDFDFKQFMLEKGERVGLGIAGGVALLLVVLCMMSVLRAGSPQKNADDLANLTKQVSQGLQTNTPRDSVPDEKPPKDNKDKLIALDISQLDRKQYQLAGIFEGYTLEAAKRRMPVLELPDEGHVATAWVPVETYVFDSKFESIYVLVPSKAEKNPQGSAGGRTGGLNNLGRGGFLGGMSGGMGMGGAGMGGGMGAGGGRAGGGFQGLWQRGPAKLEQLEDFKKMYTLEKVKLTELSKGLKGSHPARQLRPLRMAIIAASFPYKKQLEEFKTKLNLGSISEVFSDTAYTAKGKPIKAFRFLGVNVQRRVLDSAGNPISNWETLDLGASYRPWMFLSGSQKEPDDPKYRPISFQGLVMPRLLQFRAKLEGKDAGRMDAAKPDTVRSDGDNHYPPVEERVENITRTLRSLEAKKPEEIVTVPKEFSSGPVDPFNPDTGEDDKDDKKTTGNPGMSKDAVVPEHCLIRLMDLSIEPGRTYQYRIQVRMANPNQNRLDVADPSWSTEAELHPVEGKWFEIPDKVTVPPELVYYAVDEKELDKNWKDPNGDVYPNKARQAVLQIHRWIDATTVAGIGGGTEPVFIGEWAVAERVPVYRGEYVDQKTRVEMPVWSHDRDAFIVPTDKTGRDSKKSGILISFSHFNERGEETVLVDFEPAEQSYRGMGIGEDGDLKEISKAHDVGPSEVLLFTPEGKLLGHNSSQDALDPERTHRLKEVHDRVERVKKAMKGDKKDDKSGNPFGGGGGKS